MLLIKNIKLLGGILDAAETKRSGKSMNQLNCIEHAYLLVSDGKIKSFGTMAEWEAMQHDFAFISAQVDATGKVVLPGWCDSHTHIVYAASREEEFVDRISGLSYEQIAKRGGGILNSAKKVADATEEELFDGAMNRIKQMIQKGTTAIEIKSGYGLSVEGELKMLRIIRELKKKSGVCIKATFLGAHAIPALYKNNRRGYIDLLINEIMPQIADEHLADYCDVFCEDGYFTQDETIEILESAKLFGMIPKVHANQMSNSGGVQAGVQCHARSVDHLEYVAEEEIKCLLNSHTMPTVLPGAAFFLSLPLPPARKMIDAGLPVAVATDFNPGSSPTGDMNFMQSLLCIQYKLTPAEAIHAGTINSAYAMHCSEEMGSITVGKAANFYSTKKVPSLAYLPYSFNENLIDEVYVNGKNVK
jgi:imidazolonepropionase